VTCDLRPSYVTPDELAAHLGVPERTLRETARALGACRIIGKRTVMLAEDVAKLMEAARPCDSSCTARTGQSGITEAPLTGGDFAALQKRLTEKKPKGSRRKSSTKLGTVISMDRGRG
jgi:hypothetical protein